MQTPTAQYIPPATPDELVLAWLRRARESQLSHYVMANRLERRHFWVGVPVVAITAVVGASAFASILTELVPLWSKVAAGFGSVFAGVLASLQTFFRFSERAERHRTFAAKFGAIRRELETLHASGRTTNEQNWVNALRERLDRLAEEAPAVHTEVFESIQKPIASQ